MIMLEELAVLHKHGTSDVRALVDEVRRLRHMLKTLADCAEEAVSTDLDVPSGRDAEELFDAALGVAHTYLNETAR